MSYWNDSPAEQKRTEAAATVQCLLEQFSRVTEAVLAKRRELGLPVFPETRDEVFELLTQADWALFAEAVEEAGQVCPKIAYQPEVAYQGFSRVLPEGETYSFLTTQQLLDELKHTFLRALLRDPVLNPATRAALGGGL